MNFLISIREDALSRLDHFKGRIANLFDNYLRLNPLDFNAGHRAIVEPVKRYNDLYLANSKKVTVEPALVQAVLEQVKTYGLAMGGVGRGLSDSQTRQTQIETPYLQLVMTRLWQEEVEKGKRCLRLKTLEKLGGAKTIVRAHLDSSMKSLSVQEQDAAASIFHYLVTPSGTKVAHSMRDLRDYSNLTEAELRPVIKNLSHGSVRILRPVGPNTGSDDDRRYEIYHDVLAAAILDWRSRHILEKQRFQIQGQLFQEKRLRLRYWLTITAIISIGIVLGNWLARQPKWIYQRDQLFQIMRPSQMHARDTVLVMIGDNEYWKGALEGRVPIKRDYLAKLIQAVAASGPAVIGLDFNLQSPTPEGNPVEFPEYQSETNRLLESIREVSYRCRIVLPMSLGIDELAYVKESDIYDNFDFRGEIYMGYIALPDDIRQIPPGLKLRDGKTVDSFASAMVRAASPASLRRIGGGEVPYHASFLSRETFPVISANEVLSAGQPKELMRNKLVIIGANWHTLGYERGPEVSAFQTPVGDIPAAFIHANYVEAILDGRVYKIWQGSALILLQVLLGLGVAIIFRLDLRFSIKLAVALLPYTALVMLNYLYLVSLDVFLPVILIIAYSVLEQIRRRPNERQAQQTAM